MTTTTTETSSAPIEPGWTDDKTRGPLYVSAPDPVLDGQQYGIHVLGVTMKNTGKPETRLTFIGDVAALESRDGIYDELDAMFGTDTHWLDADACAGLAGHLLLALTRDGMTQPAAWVRRSRTRHSSSSTSLQQYRQPTIPGKSDKSRAAVRSHRPDGRHSHQEYRMMRRVFRGGSLDGAELGIPAGTTSVTTTSGLHYELDDQGETFVFLGSSHTGRVMRQMVQEFREASRREQEAAEAAGRPKGCRSCGRTFANSAAFTVAHDPMWPGGCVPPDVAGLIEVDGVWCRPGSDAART